jgi:hypothetical protein
MMRRHGPTRYDRRTYYRGVRMVPYDLVKELVAALAATAVIIVVLSAVLSSPDVPSETIQSWAKADPVDFVTTAASELDGQSGSATYGPPYNNADGAVQKLWFLDPQEWAGAHQPVDPPQQFVVSPLQQASVGNTDLASALSTYAQADEAQRGAWLDAYSKALPDAKEQDGKVVVASGDFGPVPVMMDNLLAVARSGGLDGLLQATDKFFATDQTRPLLFMGDGAHLEALAEEQHLTGDQWGVMNETGRYPGQAWLWLYTLWYQVGPYNQDGGFLGINAANTDLAVVVTMGILTLLLLFLPFIPGLRDIPRWIPVHRLIWRRRRA